MIKQVEENKRILNVKKLSDEIIMGKSMEETAMELDGEGAENFEQLQDLIRRECNKRDRKYARLEDKYNKLEQQVTKKDPKNMPQRGQPSNNEGTGASKKNKFNKRQATKPAQYLSRKHNPGQQKRRNSVSPEQVDAKNRGSMQKNENKHSLPSQNKSTRNPRNTAGKKNPPKTPQRKPNCTIWFHS